MPNLLDYLDWRGDLTLAQSPFNEVDNLILSELSFVSFRGAVPPPGGGEGVELRTAAERHFTHAPENADAGVLIPVAIPELLRKMAASRRFSSMRLNCFADERSPDKQFAALTVETGDQAVYLSFRGTDDTLAGWKEDFALACVPEIPAQRRAVEYAKEVAKQYPRRRLRLGGHSKGGNLAVYAAVHCPQRVRRRIDAVWSNDGPGFHGSLLDLPGRQGLEGCIHTIVPKSSVVGMLLEHEENYDVVDSDQLGLLQHDGFSWQVQGDHFLHLREVTRQAQLSDRELRQWVREIPLEQRERFTEALFAVLSASGAETLTDLKTERFKAAGAMVRAMTELDKETRDGLLRLTGLLFKSNLRMALESIQDGKRRKKDTPGVS